jgi:bifunctional non-homologous end joining protein LigD
MSLTEYKSKRKLSKTPEPAGGKPSSKKLIFVVQKHAASHLHYDFRLEMHGVLKSWAVPKGPSMTPSTPRLAMMVEDHPFDYRNFEGIIPKGNYGAGTVIVWDTGTYEPAKKFNSKQEQEKELLRNLYGKKPLKIRMHGKKLKGLFALVPAFDRGENSWLLIKDKDEYATKEDVSNKDKSVISRKTIEEIAADKTSKQWISNRSADGKPKENQSGIGVQDNRDLSLLKKGRKKKQSPYKPMLATKIKEPFNNSEWTYEVKWDGFRIIAHKISGKVKLFSRSLLDYTENYPEIVSAFEQLTDDAVIDGELVVLDENGKPDFDALQAYHGSGQLVFYSFDLLWMNGYEITNLPLTERKEILKLIIPDDIAIRFSNDFEDGIALFEEAKKLGLEGIVAKKKESKYLPGVRGNDWLKVATAIHREFVIGGWTESEKNPYFRSLIFGEYQNGKFMYVGHAGGGYKDKDLPVISKMLRSREIKKSPFANEVITDHPVHFVKPELVAEIKFATYTKAKRIRKPAIFLGWRKDKKAKEVVAETDSAPVEVIAEPVETVKEPRSEQDNVSIESNWQTILNQKITSSDVVSIGGKNVQLSNVEKKLWHGVLKADLIQYYHSVAPFILPHLEGRALSLHIKHITPTQPGLYIKDMENRQPQWAEVFSTPRKHKKKGRRNKIDYLVCNDEATLIYIINLGCIDVNPWTSRVNDYLHPDYIVIDLDPSDNDFNKAVETAIAAKKFFRKKKIHAFPKTSGKTGIHLYIPCSGFTFPQARDIAEKICDEIHALVPEITTTEVSVSQRGNKLYLDPNQNDEADTVAAPYSVRPSDQPTVSAPLEWKEVKRGLSMNDFTIHTMAARIKKKGDLFKNVLSKTIQRKNNPLLKNILKS